MRSAAVAAAVMKTLPTDVVVLVAFFVVFVVVVLVIVLAIFVVLLNPSDILEREEVAELYSGSRCCSLLVLMTSCPDLMIDGGNVNDLTAVAKEKP